MKIRTFVFFSMLFFDAFIIIPTIHAQLPPGIVSECDFCQCSMGISPLVAMGGSSIRYDARYTELGTITQNGVPQPNTTNHVQQFFTQVLSFNYQIVPDLSATLALPLAHKMETSDNPSDLLGSTGTQTPNDPNTITNIGLADISLRMQYYLIAEHTMDDMHILAATAGVKFATGSMAFADMGQPADPDIELSTGTTDFILGLGYMQGFDNWTIGADGLFNIRGPGPGYDGHVYGNNFNYDVTGRYRIYQNDNAQPGSLLSSAFASLGIRGEWRGYELQNGQPLNNDSLGWSGGNVIYVAPGAQVFFSPRVSLDVAVWIPFIHALYGTQLAETVRAIVGIQYGL